MASRNGLAPRNQGYQGAVKRKKTVDTEAVASEIVSLRNRLAELEEHGEANTDEWDRLHERLLFFQDQLAGAPAKDGAEGSGNGVQYVPPG